MKHQAEDFVEFAEEKASDILERVHEKTDRIKESLPSTGQIKSKVKHQILDPIEDKTIEVQNFLFLSFLLQSFVSS